MTATDPFAVPATLPSCVMLLQVTPWALRRRPDGALAYAVLTFAVSDPGSLADTAYLRHGVGTKVLEFVRPVLGQQRKCTGLRHGQLSERSAHGDP
jgi:hypothetical protein